MGKLSGLRTQIFNIVMAVLMLLSIYNPGAELPGAEAVDSALDGLEGALAVIWALGVAIFRAIATVPGPLGAWVQSHLGGDQP